jgi:hypothetical protein
MAKKDRAPKSGVNPEEMDFLRLMSLETDRGCWLIATSVIENAIEQLLRSGFEILRGGEDADAEVDDLFNKRPLPILGNLWVKTRLARALGLIPADFGDFLDSLRDSRNEFAHRPYPLEITCGDVEQLVQIIPTWKYMTEQILSPTAEWFWQHVQSAGESPNLSNPRKQFMALARTARSFIQSREDHFVLGKVLWSTNPDDWVHARVWQQGKRWPDGCRCPNRPIMRAIGGRISPTIPPSSQDNE